MRLETTTDSLHEERIARKAADAWGQKLNETLLVHKIEGRFSMIDRYFVNEAGQVRAVVEIKAKMRANYGDYNIIPVDHYKWCALAFSAMGFNVAGLVIFGYKNGIYYAMTEYCMGWPVKVMGRPDPRPEAPNDKTPAICVPKDQFEFLCDSAGVFGEPELETEETVYPAEWQ
jgi:hypothetical protein